MSPRASAVTLVELMIALVLGALVVALAFQFYTRLHRDFQAQTAIAETQQQLSQVHTMLGRVLHSVGATDAPYRGGLLGGRLWMPASAATRFPAGPAAVTLPGGAHPGLGFRFVTDNWRSRADVFDVSYFASGDSSMQGSARYVAVKVTALGQWTGAACDTGYAGPDFSCATVTAPGSWFTNLTADLAAGIREFFVLSSGYHGCLVEFRSPGISGAVHWEPGGLSINAAISGYCGNDAAGDGPFKTALSGLSYCSETLGYSNRACYLFEFGHTGGSLNANDLGPARLRRYYVCGPAGSGASLDCMTEDTTSSYQPTIPELHALVSDGYVAPRDRIVAMGIEDAQISWKLHAFNNACPTNCPCPDTTLSTAESVTLKALPNVTSAKYDSVLPVVVAGGTTEQEDGCDDEARWFRRITLTLMAATDAPYGTTPSSRSGLRGLNANFNCPPDTCPDTAGATGAHILRRLLRIESYLRNIGP